MNSTYTTFDWHAKGVYVAHDPQGHVLWGTFADNAYSSRSELIRQVNRPWSAMRMDGYVIHAYQPVNIITPTEMEALLEGSTNQS
jgi:hypothetical protein